MTLGKRTSTTVTILPLFTLFALPFFLFPSLFYNTFNLCSSTLEFLLCSPSRRSTCLSRFHSLFLPGFSLMFLAWFFLFFSFSFLFSFVYQSRPIPLAFSIVFSKLHSLRTRRATFSKRQPTNVNARAENRDVVI